MLDLPYQFDGAAPILRGADLNLFDFFSEPRLVKSEPRCDKRIARVPRLSSPSGYKSGMSRRSFRHLNIDSSSKTVEMVKKT